MDVTPPSTLRRLGIALAGLAVAALTGAACALSFDDLRELAIHGEARPDLAFLYPAAFDALLVVALIGVLLLRSARLLVRTQAAVVLVLLIVAAAAVNVATTVRFQFDVRQAAVGVAVAPWVMLAVALWLWLLLINHVQARRSAVHEEEEIEDLVPFHRPQPAEAPRPHAPQEQEAAPPISERVTRWSAPPEPPKETVPEPVVEIAPEPIPAPRPSSDPELDTRTRTQPEEPTQPQAQLEPDDQPESDEQPEPEAHQEPEAPTLAPPVRWGDRVKPSDVLVHPRQPDVSERDTDTQPVRVIKDDEENPDPGHGPEQADESELSPDDAPPAEAPSGRLRSTPLPPEE